jgi:hypothetical protein
LEGISGLLSELWHHLAGKIPYFDGADVDCRKQLLNGPRCRPSRAEARVCRRARSTGVSASDRIYRQREVPRGPIRPTSQTGRVFQIPLPPSKVPHLSRARAQAIIAYQRGTACHVHLYRRAFFALAGYSVAGLLTSGCTRPMLLIFTTSSGATVRAAPASASSIED